MAYAILEHIGERSLKVPSERNLLNDYLAKILNICKCCDSSKLRKCDRHINHSLIIAKKKKLSSGLQIRPRFPNRFHPIGIWIDQLPNNTRPLPSMVIYPDNGLAHSLYFRCCITWCLISFPPAFVFHLCVLFISRNLMDMGNHWTKQGTLYSHKV